MARSKKTRTITAQKKQFSTDETQEVIIPDDALRYIVSHYIQEKNKGDMPVVIGISSSTVEAVLQLLVDWAAASGYVKDGVLTLGEQEE